MVCWDVPLQHPYLTTQQLQEHLTMLISSGGTDKKQLTRAEQQRMSFPRSDSHICLITQADLNDGQRERVISAVKLRDISMMSCDHKTVKQLELCCSEDSKLGNTDRECTLGCKIIRCTRSMGITRADTRTRLRDQVIQDGAVLGGGNLLIWVSIPCTGGTTWTYVNEKIPSAAADVSACMGGSNGDDQPAKKL